MSDQRWKRPSSVPFPSVWRRVKGRKPLADGKIPSFIIQDVPEDREEELIDFMEAHFIHNEPISKSLNFADDAESIVEIRQLWKDLLKDRVSVIAFVEGDGPRPRIAGTNMLGVTHKEDKDQPNKFKGEVIQKVINFLDTVGRVADPFHKFGVSEYMTAMGLSVAKEFQGQGLGLELLKARSEVGRAVGLRLTVTVFTAIESQVLADRAGFQLLGEIAYQEYKVDGKIVYPDVTVRSAKLMAKILE
uniref:N-acetyltransferase domain-containing protein n=1 Tax=Timema poppense TaxID=170557 RepID=A0A7R9HAI8_TIMPO|nr:unnamed protein product [Timema poppensis]